jgi:hypothetical protein
LKPKCDLASEETIYLRSSKSRNRVKRLQSLVPAFLFARKIESNACIGFPTKSNSK